MILEIIIINEIIQAQREMMYNLIYKMKGKEINFIEQVLGKVRQEVTQYRDKDVTISGISERPHVYCVL